MCVHMCVNERSCVYICVLVNGCVHMCVSERSCVHICVLVNGPVFIYVC